MKVRALLLFFLALGCWLGFARSASAEKVKTNQPTKVYSKPGEHEKVLLKLKSGQNMTVLSKEGRWLKVRVQGRTGYVPRSKVDMPDDDEIARNTRRRPFVDGRGTKRGFGGDAGPDDRVGADATGDNGSSDDDSGDKADKGDKGKDDDSDDDSGSKAKAAAKPKAKPAAKHKDDDSDDGDDSDDDSGSKAKSSKPAAKPKTKAAAKHKDDDSDDDSSGGGSDDDSADVDDSKSGEPDDSDKRPTAHVSAKTVAYNDDNADSGEEFTAKPSMVLYPGEHKGKWTFVENDDGDAGWVRTSSLEVDDDDGGGGDGGGTLHKRQIDTHARLGVQFIGQAMKSAGSTIVRGAMFDPDDYSIGAPTATLALGGTILWPYKTSYVLGVEGTLDYSKSLLGGINIPAGSTMGAPSGTSTGISLATYNLRLVAGYDLHKKSGLMLFGRLGYRYQSFSVDGYGSLADNPAMLPQETIGAPTLGAGIGVPHLTDKLGLAITLDAVLAGASITQTKGYQDGTSPSEKAAYIGGVVTYHWKKDMDLQGAYDLDIASLDFGKPYSDMTLNKRGHTGTDTTRSDIFNMFTFGVAKSF